MKTFAALTKEFTTAASEIVILPVPFDKTSSYQKGSDKGPSALLQASCNMELYDIETDSEVYRRGIYTDKAIQARSSEKMIELTYQRVKSLLAKDKFVVTLGGEHTISYGAIKAHAEHHGAITVLQFDAHSDLHPAYENNPWSHASVMARVGEIPQVSKIVAIGIRSVSPDEKHLVSNTFFAHEPIKAQEVLAKLTGPVYITFDLDVFDSSLMPSTGTPEPGGLFWNETMQLLKAVFEKKSVVGFDVVELCPIAKFNAPNFLAAKLVYKALSYRFRYDSR